MHGCDASVSEPVPASSAGVLADPSAVSDPRWRHVAAARWRVWAPIALRALALAIALLGLAGIGAVAGRAPQLSPPAVSRAGLELGALSSQALAALGGAGGGPPAPPPPTPAPAASPPPSTPADPAPCPRAPSAQDARPPPPLPPNGSPPPGERGAADRERPVALNRADAAELRRLPGVGAKRAEAILSLRQRLGRFRKPTDLLRIKGIGPRTLERMLPLLVID
jgi:competence protein ComEA